MDQGAQTNTWLQAKNRYRSILVYDEQGGWCTEVRNTTCVIFFNYTIFIQSTFEGIFRDNIGRGRKGTIKYPHAKKIVPKRPDDMTPTKK